MSDKALGFMITSVPEGWTPRQVKAAAEAIQEGIDQFNGWIGHKYALNPDDQCKAEKPTTGRPHYCGLWVGHAGPHQCVMCADSDNVTWED